MFVYEFIEEMRLRINKGLRIAEKYSRKSLHNAAGTKSKRSPDETLIKTLRQEYRVALREGVLDSKQDFDLLLLAKELNAYLATIDGGLIHWAQKIGICCITAEELKETGKAKARKYESVTILFTDFKGFTSVAAGLEPEDLVNEINECYIKFDEIITRHGIEKIKTIGDAYMAAGGLPVKNDTHGLDIVKAAIEIRDFMTQLKEEREKANKLFFEIRIGIHSGPVVAGVKNVWVITDHVTKDGQHKLVNSCSFPLTGKGIVDRIYSNLAILDRVEGGFKVRELAPGVSFEYLQERSEPELIH